MTRSSIPDAKFEKKHNDEQQELWKKVILLFHIEAMVVG